MQKEVAYTPEEQDKMGYVTSWKGDLRALKEYIDGPRP
jgi:hypothetical protein